ncbi:hypothetical protein NF700_13380 [Sphingomonadaceae bacterium OTU29MARTA1]|nr:hypothetical protein NF700_13380 [Sphingomonadaceae bacterium OTU29MARTA1]
MRRIALVLSTVLLAAPTMGQVRSDGGTALWQRFETPPADARPMVRWWWFGPSVDDAELSREIAAMKAGGFGGFEVQPTYPLALDGQFAGVRNAPYLSDGFIASLRHAGARARAEGMRIDVTIGSGWPFGGPHVPVDEASSALRRMVVPVPAGANRIALPAWGAGETPVGLFLGDRRLDVAAPTIVPAVIAREALLFVAGRTGQQVKRPSLGAEGFVLDHANGSAVRRHLTQVGDRLLTAFAGAAPPTAMFSDSLEAYGAGWTDDLPAEFRRRRGYDLLDHLPALFDDRPDGADVRYDWAKTLSELVDERYLRPITDWAHAHGTRFRAQVYGFPPPTLSSNALVDLPEGEGADWRRFTSTRWATSAAHLYDRAVVSSETWTWLHSPTWAATPLDMKVEADRHFLQGVNQLVGHGWPYSPPGIAEPGWAFYAAAALSDHNPWYPAMPAVTGYLARVSAMLREGAADPDVAIYVPTEDAFAAMRPARASLNEAIRARLDPMLVDRVLDAGRAVDFIDGAAVLAGKLRHRTLILPQIERIDPAAYRAIADYAARGGTVIALGALPNRGVGLREAAAGNRTVAAVSRALSGSVRVVAPEGLSGELAAHATVALVRPDPAFGFVRRRLPAGDLYFVANTGPVAIDTTARFVGDTGNGQWWDPVTGERSPAGTGAIALRLAPYQSRILIFGDRDMPAGATSRDPGAIVVRDLSTGWRTSVGAQLQPGRSWDGVAGLKGYSGAITYTREVETPKAGGGRLLLDFGEGRPRAGDGGADRPRAAIDAPVRDAAIVRVNGQTAGTVWTAPWRIDVTRWLKPGRNRVEVTVMNTALNALGARPAPDRRLLVARYGDRFQDQDQDKIVAQPSGLMGRITLLRSQ